VFLLIVTLFWRPGEPPILLYIFLFQWLESSVWIYYDTFRGLRVDDGSPSGAGRQLATVLLLIGLAVQAIGVRWAAGEWSSQDRELAESQLNRVRQNTWLRLYLVATVVSVGAALLAKLFPLLSQPLLSVVYLRWAAYVVLTFATFFRADASKPRWLLVFLLELLFSLGDYFSSFKFVFLFTFVGLAAAQVKVSIRQKVGLVFVVILALLFGSIWSEIKGEYRNFVSGGERAQIVTVDFSRRIDKLVELTSSLDWYGVLDGFDLLLRRIEYVEYFGEVTRFVPVLLSHTGGERWLDAIIRPFMPRLIFSNKPIIDESDITSRFTGLAMAGFNEGTQISIGYIGETYIDFGRYAMMPVLFLWGLFLGLVYRWLLLGKYTRGVLGMGLVSPTLIMTSGSIGSGLAKLVGGLIVTILVMWLFSRLVVPRWLPWLRAWSR